MNKANEFEGFSVWIYGERESEPAIVNDEPFTLGVLGTVLIKLVNSGASEEEWQQTAGCLMGVLAPGTGAITQSLADQEPHDAALELNFNVVGGTLLTPAQGTLVILRNGGEFTYASLTLAINPWMWSGPQEIVDRIKYDLFWAAILRGYDVETAREAEDAELGAKLIVFENAATHCLIRARNKKPADAWFYVKAGSYSQT